MPPDQSRPERRLPGIYKHQLLGLHVLAEGLEVRLEDDKRPFRICDPAPFLASIEEQKASHSAPGKRKPNPIAAPRLLYPPT